MIMVKYSNVHFHMEELSLIKANVGVFKCPLKNNDFLSTWDKSKNILNRKYVFKKKLNKNCEFPFFEIHPLNKWISNNVKMLYICIFLPHYSSDEYQSDFYSNWPIVIHLKSNCYSNVPVVQLLFNCSAVPIFIQLLSDYHSIVIPIVIPFHFYFNWPIVIPCDQLLFNCYLIFIQLFQLLFKWSKCSTVPVVIRLFQLFQMFKCSNYYLIVFRLF